MNYGAGALLVAGGIVLVIGIKGSQSAVWKSLTGNAIVPSGSTGFGGIAGGTFGTPVPAPAPNPSPSQINNRYRPQGYYQGIAYADAQAAGINQSYFVKQIQQESGFNPSAQSGAGAEGIAQFMPATAKGLGVDPWNAVASLGAAAKLMGNYIRTYGSEAAGLAAYNAGPGTYMNAVNASQYGGGSWQSYLPLETQNYIKTIMA